MDAHYMWASIVISYVSLAVISFDIMTGAIVVVTCFAGCILVPESAIDSVLLLGELGWAPIQFIKLILGLRISILLVISPKRHLHPFFLTLSSFLW